MRRSARIALSVVLVAGWLSASAVPATANSYWVKDRRDVRNNSALDILATKVGHKGDRLLHAVTLERSVTPESLKQVGGFIDFLISTDGDLDTFERRVYVLGGSRFRVFVTNGSGRKLIGRGKAYHPKPHTLGAVISPNALGRPDGYDWFAVAVTDGPGDCCVDVAPKYWYIHDLTSPAIGDVTFGDGPKTAVPGQTVPITWTASDTGFGGLSNWTVRQRVYGSAPWSDVGSGRYGLDPRVFAATETTDFPAAAEGTTYEACVSFLDWAENAATSGAYGFSIPYDDENAVLQYSADWSEVGIASDFNGTLHVTSTDSASVTITVPAGLQRFLVVRGGITGTMSVQVNGMASTSIDLSSIPSGQSRVLIQLYGNFHASGGDDDVVVLTKTGGDSIGIDGYLGAPAYVSGVAYAGCGGDPTLSLIGPIAREAAISQLSSTRVVTARSATPRRHG